MTEVEQPALIAVSETLRLRAYHPDRDDVLELLLGQSLDEDDIEEWFEHRREWFEA